MTPLSKYELFNPSAKTYSQMKLSLISSTQNSFYFNYTIYSRKSYKNFLKFSTEDRFDFHIKPDINMRESSMGSLDELRKKEILIKFLKTLNSKITRLYVRFVEKPMSESVKTMPNCEVYQEKTTQIEENSIMKSIFLLETE